MAIVFGHCQRPWSLAMVSRRGQAPLQWAIPQGICHCRIRRDSHCPWRTIAFAIQGGRRAACGNNCSPCPTTAFTDRAGSDVPTSGPPSLANAIESRWAYRGGRKHGQCI